MGVISLTLEIPWESVRTFNKQFIRTAEGPRIDILSLKKAELNSNKISIKSKQISFDEDLLKSPFHLKSTIYFKGVNNSGADGFVKNIRIFG